MGGPIAIPRPAADSAREVIRPAYEGASDVRRGIPVAQTILAPIPIRIRDRKHILTNQTPPKNKSQRQNKKYESGTKTYSSISIQIISICDKKVSKNMKHHLAPFFIFQIGVNFLA